MADQLLNDPDTAILDSLIGECESESGETLSQVTRETAVDIWTACNRAPAMFRETDSWNAACRAIHKALDGHDLGRLIFDHFSQGHPEYRAADHRSEGGLYSRCLGYPRPGNGMRALRHLAKKMCGIELGDAVDGVPPDSEYDGGPLPFLPLEQIRGLDKRLHTRSTLPSATIPPVPARKVPPPIKSPLTKPPKTRESVVADMARAMGATVGGVWEYHDSDGGFNHCRVRFNRAGKKEVLPLSLKGLSWKFEEPAAGPLPLFNLATLTKTPHDVPVHFPAGEKCVDRLAAFGMIATTNAGGEGALSKTDLSPLNGRKLIVIYVDNDEPGERWLRSLLAWLAKNSPQTAVKVLRFSQMGPSGDVADLVDTRRAGGVGDEQIKTEIDAMIGAAPGVNLRDFLGMLVTRSLQDVPVTPISWLRRLYLAREQITLIAGMTSAGKSMLLMYLISCLTRGRPFFGEDESHEPMSVLLFAPEDTTNILNIRLRAVDADLRRVHVIEGQQAIDPKTGQKRIRPFSLPGSLESVAANLAEHPEIGVVILDPITGAMLGADINDQSDVRGPLQILSAFAEQHKLAILATTHINKSANSGPALSRTLGSVAFQNLVRLSFLVVPDRQDEQLKFFLPTKSNLGQKAPGRAYRIAPSADPDTPTFEIVDGEVDEDADKLLGKFENPDKADRKADAVEEAIRTILEDGKPHSKQEVIDQGRRLHGGHGSASTYEKAAAKLGVLVTPRGRQSALWSLPSEGGAE